MMCFLALWNLIKGTQQTDEFLKWGNQPDSNGKTTLHEACLRLHDESPNIIETLLKANLSCYATDTLSQTPLHYLCHPQLAELSSETSMATKAARPSQSSKKEEGHIRALSSPLPRLTTAQLSTLENVQFSALRAFLSSTRVNVNAVSHGGWTPIHYCCKNGFTRAVGLLLQRGANADVILDSPFRLLEHGKTPLEIARIYSRTEIENLLTEWYTKGTLSEAMLDLNLSGQLIPVASLSELPRTSSSDSVGTTKDTEIIHSPKGSSDSLGSEPHFVKVPTMSSGASSLDKKSLSDPLSHSAGDWLISSKREKRTPLTSKKKLYEVTERLGRELTALNAKFKEQAAQIQRLEDLNKTLSRSQSRKSLELAADIMKGDVPSSIFGEGESVHSLMKDKMIKVEDQVRMILYLAVFTLLVSLLAWL